MLPTQFSVSKWSVDAVWRLVKAVAVNRFVFRSGLYDDQGTKECHDATVEKVILLGLIVITTSYLQYRLFGMSEQTASYMGLAGLLLVLSGVTTRDGFLYMALVLATSVVSGRFFEEYRRGRASIHLHLDPGLICVAVLVAYMIGEE